MQNTGEEKRRKEKMSKDRISLTDISKNKILFEIKLSQVFIGNRYKVCDIHRVIDEQLSKLSKLKHISLREFEKFTMEKK